jgi:hypothetical protein
MGLFAIFYTIYRVLFWTYVILQFGAVLLPRGRWKLFGLFGLVIPLVCNMDTGGRDDGSGEFWLGVIIVAFFSLIFHNIIWMIDRSIGD